VDGADADVDGVDAEALAAVVDEVLLVPPPQPESPTATESPTARTRVRHARRTAHKQTRSRHRERL
jgi:hypothetical protein